MKKKYRLMLFLCLLQASFPGFAQVVLNGSSGPDMGAAINSAVTSFPANGGSIKIEPQANGQCYSFSTPIVIDKAVIIKGEGPATCLIFSGSGTAISLYNNNTPYAPAHTYADGFGLRDLTLLGSGSQGGQIGIALGGTENSVGFYGSGLTIGDFGIGLQFYPGVWNFKIEHSIFGQNNQSIFWPSNLRFGGENVEFDSDTFVGATFANSLEFNVGTDSISDLNNLTFVSCNFDDAQLVINNGSGSIRLYSPHFENPSQLSGNEPFVRISAYTAATDVLMDGPDFYNDQSSPYPPDFIEIDGSPTVTISQIRSVNLDGSQNVPSNVAINGDAIVTLLADAPLRAAQQQYVVNSGNPQLSVLGGVGSSNEISSPTPLMYSQNNGPDNQSPVVQIGGDGYQPAVGFNLWTGSGSSFYGAQIRETGPGELDFCTDGSNTLTGGNYVCNAGVVNGVFKSLVPDGTAPFTVASHTPPDNLNAWPATFDPSGQQIENPHITTAKVILPSQGEVTVPFKGTAAFTRTPQCTANYQTSLRPVRFFILSVNPSPNGITIFGQPYIGVYFVCIGN
ncbi:MAG: hypothetical protein WA634_11305 [Silvibacterium sp.]